ncbi:pyridoxamine 5'-phosphate oxidase family protein [Nocardiopsis exhalans]|uniref:Pyridoxamine 5'-phosphate oxidase family protein n=2 Tax=Nocardiopsis TaxID=2013 RepID=A0ABY5D357_9ACTN|nr:MULTISPECIES: pyridoxamine 5'-phosphate oxidase family protein [Nocardiopsis]MBB5491045.1 PPOX class probable F420-dependent enzyme [Nocardiopsis metallicus]USY17622.1 pyridoxamine 5'-phosphate oxidase family protein [Nocardiopsis exhalans]
MPEPDSVPTFLPAPEHLRRRLAEDRNVWLCTLRADGSPHVVPVWFVYLRERWWIGVCTASVKVRNALRDPRVSLALEDGDAPVVAQGLVTVHERFPGDVLAAFHDRYDWDPRTPYGADPRRSLLEVGVTRWLMAGTAPDTVPNREVAGP